MTENSNAHTYQVAAGDTLQSIAIKMECTISDLKQANNLFSNIIFPGDVLVIPGKSDERLGPIDAALYDCDAQRVRATGRLLILGAFLRFEPVDTLLNPIVAKLVCHAENAVFPYPSEEINNDPSYLERADARYILAVTFISDVDSRNTFNTYYFCCARRDVIAFKQVLDRITKEIQKKENYTPMNINKIIAEQKQQQEQTEANIAISKPVANEEAPPPRKVKPPMLKPITFIGGKSNILSTEDFEKIRAVLPTRFKQLDWKLLFKLSEDGSSFITFFNATDRCEPIIMILISKTGDRIGAYISQQLKKSREFYGTGETFVFRFNPSFEYFGWKEDSNQYFVLSSSQEISIGGGGASAIWIDGNLLNAFSEPCPTFNSPSLTSTKKFKISDLEIWTIPSTKKKYQLPSSL